MTYTVIDAPLDSSGAGRGEERAPAALRSAGLVSALRAEDGGAVDARIQDSSRDAATGVIGAEDVRRATASIAAAVGDALQAGRRPLVLGGDCTLLLGVFTALPEATALWFVDGHADFLDGRTSSTGEAADMGLATLTGHGPPGLLASARRLLAPSDAVLLGHRPAELDEEVARENERLDPAITALTALEVRERGPATVGADTAARSPGRPVWLHIDLDVLDADEFPAVTYAQPAGLRWNELSDLCEPLAAAPGLLGVSIADFNPDLDPDGRHAARAVAELARILGTPPAGS